MAGPGQRRADRVFRDAQPRADLAIRLPLEVVLLDDLGVRLGQVLEHLLDLVAVFDALELETLAVGLVLRFGMMRDDVTQCLGHAAADDSVHDDAAGEAYDKTARLLGLPYPGGPALDAMAQHGNARAFAFPRHRAGGDSLDLSFSGLKTSVRYFLESSDGRGARREDVAASFQAAVVDVLMARLQAAFARARYAGVVLSGGVAANSALQAAVRAWSERYGVRAFIPPPKYCTDNAAMIAAAAYHQRDADDQIRADMLLHLLDGMVVSGLRPRRMG